MADPASQLLQCYSARLSRVVLSEQSIEQLHTEGLISEEALDEVESCGSFLMGDPLRAVCIAVAEDHSKLRDLANILLKSDESLANELHIECGEWLIIH